MGIRSLISGFSLAALVAAGMIVPTVVQASDVKIHLHGISLGTTMVINTIMGTDRSNGIVTGTTTFSPAIITAVHPGTVASTAMAIVTTESLVASVTATRDSTRVTVSTNDVKHGVGSATSWSRLNHDVSAADSQKHPGLGPT